MEDEIKGEKGVSKHRERDKDRDFVENLVSLNRVTKVVKGGRRFSFAALMVVGDRKGRVGYGFGKAGDVSEAIRKSLEKAKKNMVVVPLKKGTLPHEVIGCFNRGKILLKPATPGTGIIAGGPVRLVMEALGVHDILSKSLGSRNSLNAVKAVFAGFEQIVSAKKLSERRQKPLNELWG